MFADIHVDKVTPFFNIMVFKNISNFLGIKAADLKTTTKNTKRLTVDTGQVMFSGEINYY